MNVQITYIDTDSNLILKFMRDWNGLRLWIRDPKAWFQTVGQFCPHINFNGFECSDCSLNVE